MRRLLLIVLTLAVPLLVAFDYSAPGDNGFAAGETVTHVHMNQLDAALDSMQVQIDFLAVESLNWLDAGSINSLSKINAILITETIADGPHAVVLSGSQAMGTSAISANSCATVVTVSASGVATTDVVSVGFNGDPTAVTGYGPGASDGLAIYSYPTTNNVNFKVCNMTGSEITPGALTVNWRVVQ